MKYFSLIFYFFYKADFDFDLEGSGEGATEDNIFVTGLEQEYLILFYLFNNVFMLEFLCYVSVN